jgi:predicted nuclease of predicted toxin-antitoxin system
MNKFEKKYCLDANVLIQAWQKYYSPKICPSYWDILDLLGEAEKIFLPEEVYKEITRTEDELSQWLKSSNIPIRKIDENVTKCLKDIYSANPIHKFLVDNTKARSLADPWVIAHAINEGAVVVTKEEKVTARNSKRIKIPNVCDNMNIEWMNDFQMVAELNIKFDCTIDE